MMMMMVTMMTTMMMMMMADDKKEDDKKAKRKSKRDYDKLRRVNRRKLEGEETGRERNYYIKLIQHINPASGIGLSVIYI